MDCLDRPPVRRDFGVLGPVLLHEEGVSLDQAQAKGDFSGLLQVEARMEDCLSRTMAKGGSGVSDLVYQHKEEGCLDRALRRKEEDYLDRVCPRREEDCLDRVLRRGERDCLGQVSVKEGFSEPVQGGLGRELCLGQIQAEEEALALLGPVLPHREDFSDQTRHEVASGQTLPHKEACLGQTLNPLARIHQYHRKGLRSGRVQGKVETQGCLDRA